jgi:hypothetical protein
MITFLCFMSCKYLDMFWNKINEVLKNVKFENNIWVQNFRQIQDIINYSDIYKIEGAIIFFRFLKSCVLYHQFLPLSR